MCLYEFPRTAIANDHKPVAYNNRNLFSQSCGGRNLRSKCRQAALLWRLERRTPPYIFQLLRLCPHPLQTFLLKLSASATL